MSKSYWQKMACSTARDRRAVKSWFGFVCEDMTPESAEILCDIETDREKKLRAIMIDKDGRRRRATRTLGGKTFTIKLEPVRP